MKKNLNLDDLNEKELTEYLSESENEDLKADETTIEDGYDEDTLKKLKREEELKESRSMIREEVELKSESERKKDERAEKKLNRKLLAERNKKIKKHRRELKKHPSTLLRYDVDPAFGLPTEVVEQRYLDELVNKTAKKKSKSIGRIICSNVFTFFNFLILVIAACLIFIAFYFHRWEPITDLAFFLIAFINTIIGIIQEIRAKKTIDSLSLINESYAIVKRNGIDKEIPVDEVVLDDLMLLTAGKQICADSIVIDGQIEVNESLLTGESDSVIKKPGDKLFSGSFVVSGNCSCRVDKIGKDNYIEQLSKEASAYKKPKSDLLISLNLIIKFMAIPVILIGAGLFIRQFFNSNVDMFNNIRKTAGAMVGMIPSGLLLMSSIALYVGVIRLGQKNVLVQELYCIEMLARVNCICLDKTGTITDGTMVVKNVIDYDQVSGLASKNIISAILNALPDRNMTSDALINKFGLAKRMKFTATIPFSSQRKYQAVTFERYGTFILGAPEFALGEDYKRVAKDVEKYANRGYRVLCLAYKSGEITENNLPEGPITVLSMILIEDNIRPDAIATIDYFKNSGVDVRVISGDNPITVSKISERAGVPNADNFISLDGMTDEEVARAALRYTVFGRVTPAQKKIIVLALKKAGKTCAMTGDGVNDILALREADCSIALGSGSEATRSCSHLVLLDSNFGSMPSVVAEGRRVINNVASVASLFLTKTIFSLLLGIIAIFSGVYPVTPKQLILIEVLAIGLPSLLLVNEPNNNPVKGRFLPNVIRKALPGALVIVILSLIIFLLSENLGLDDKSQTTILAIVATHTSLMVLFKACRPFTALRKILCTICYTLFLIAVLFVPYLLEFKPILSFNEYYSDTETFTYMQKITDVEISSPDFYVIDGKITTIRKSDSDKQELSAVYSSEDKSYYYAINDNKTDVKMVIPDISYDKYGHIYAGGYKINNLEYTDGIEKDFIVDTKGYVYYKDTNNPVMITLTKANDYYGFKMDYGNYNEKDATVNYCILPTVKVENNRYIINGETPSDGYYYASPNFAQMFASGELEISMNPQTMELLVNGETIRETMDNGTTGDTYKVAMPNISTCGNRLNSVGNIERTLYFGGIKSTYTIFNIYGEDDDVSDIVGGSSKSYSYTLTKEEAGETINYTYFPAFDTVYKYESSIVLDKTNLEEYLCDDFEFSDFYTKDFGEYTGTRGAVEVNSNGDLLRFGIDEKTKSVYDLLQGYNSETETYALQQPTVISVANAQFAPKIEISEQYHYIIDDYYTDYEYSVGTDLVESYYEDDEESGKYYLQLGGYKTDYEVNVVTTTGGLVACLNLTNKIFLLCLCLAAAPLMKLLQYAIPWIKKQGNNISKIVNRW